jgi:hypothetical protein
MDEWTAGGGVAAVALTALLAYLRKRRGKGGRLRARLHLSFRSPPSEPESTPSSEPPPYPSESERPTHPPERRSRAHRRRKPP